MPSAGEHGTLHFMAFQEVLFIKSLLSRAEDIADFSNKLKKKQRGRQNDKTEKLISSGRTRQGHGQRSK